MTTAIVDHLWQSTLFAIVAWLLTLVLRNNAARVRYWVWLAASIKFLIPFSLLAALGSLFTWQSSAPAAANNVFITTVQQLAEPLATPEIVLRSPQAQAFDFLPIVIAIWVVGCVLLLARWGVSWARIVAAARRAAPIAIQAPIAVKSTSIMSEPGVVGVLRPVLLLPEGIAARLNAAQMQAILAHELCHVRRRDNLTAAIHMIVEVFFWFHPLVWWIGACLIEERERACDESVVELGNEPQAYAEGILKVCQFYLESKLTCVAGVSGANLKKRVEVIMSNRIVDNLNVGKRILLATTASLAIVVPLSLGLMSSPQALAQSQKMTIMPLAFDEVSVALTPPVAPGGKPSGWFIVEDGRYSIKNLPLRYSISFAYDVEKGRIVGGPDWLDTIPYHIEAKSNRMAEIAGPARMEAYRSMVGALLANRFGIITHKEVRSVPVYVLRVGDQGETFTEKSRLPELPAWKEAQPRKPEVRADKAGINYENVSMQSFAEDLTRSLGRTVLNQTQIDGKYSFRVEVSRTPGVPFGESIAAQVEKQLGLKLEPQMASLEVVVIDAIHQPSVDPPSAATADSKASTAISPHAESERLLDQRKKAATPEAAVTGKQTTTASSLIVPAVASVRPTTSTAMRAGQIVQHDEDAFTATNTTLKELITTAYGGAPGRIVGGPPWIETARFDVTLKLVPPNQLPNIPEKFRGTRIESYKGMQVQLQELLAHRFGLILRNESNVVHTLVVATDGVKLQASNAGALDWRGVRDDGHSLIAQGASVQELLAVLSARLSRPMLNRTALNDTYDFELRLPANATSLDAQKLSDALTEQLGLSLGSIAIPTLVIERATKPGEVI
jgi:bla regulator protein BlaR1